jgi:hypothetical protein
VLCAVLLEPLGRICDLLDANPKIEPSSDGAWLWAQTASELGAILDNCETQVVDTACGGVTRTLALEELGAVAANKDAAHNPAVGAQLVSLKCPDHQFIKVSSTVGIEVARLEYPCVFQ